MPQGQPHDLAQRFIDVEEGDELVLEMVNKNGRSVISITKVGPQGETIQLDGEGESDEGRAGGSDAERFRRHGDSVLDPKRGRRAVSPPARTGEGCATARELRIASTLKRVGTSGSSESANWGQV
jgi:hypothetical protein